MIIRSVDEATRSGARLSAACKTVGLSSRAIQRWKREADGGEDRRQGPRTKPGNSLSRRERERVVEIMNSPAFRDQPPKQIVPQLADQGVYVASESTMYRILREEKLNTHRSASKPRRHTRPREHVAVAPNQVWTWDITYLKGPVVGTFFYLYLIVDIFSRKIVGYSVHESESSEHAARLVEAACRREGIGKDTLVIHQDNGAPMKGATLKATLEKLAVLASYSRPHVSDDNPFSEALFRTLKYRPEYPTTPFGSLEAAMAWVERFVHWYNTAHRHSAISFVTPDQRHEGLDVELLSHRHEVYQKARAKHPERWSGRTRNWQRTEAVYLNPQESDNVVTKHRRAYKSTG